jgi:transitional endoplasmic reticulum ATPase
MTLKNRPLDFGINYERLATLTENYISADITDLIVPDASKLALKTKSRITMKMLEDVINNTSPSVPIQELEKYKQINLKMVGNRMDSNSKRPRIGF